MRLTPGEKVPSRLGKTELELQSCYKVGRKTTKMNQTHITDSLSLFGCVQNECTPPAINSDVMRQMRTVIRSMLTADGVVVAMDDAAIVWKPEMVNKGELDWKPSGVC